MDLNFLAHTTIQAEKQAERQTEREKEGKFNVRRARNSSYVTRELPWRVPK